MSARLAECIDIFFELVKRDFFRVGILLCIGFPLFSKADEGDNNKLNKVQIKAAKFIYKQNCANCHGRKAKGNRIVPGFTDKQLDYYQTIKTVVGGKNKMPAFGNTLNNSEIALVVAYLKTLYNDAFDSISIKKAMQGKYRLLYKNDSSKQHIHQEITFKKNNTFSLLDLLDKRNISGNYYITKNGIVLMDDKKKLLYMLQFVSIKNIKKELKILDLNSGKQEDKFAFIKVEN